MAITFACRRCGLDYLAADESAGQRWDCEGCGRPIDVPEPDPAGGSTADEATLTAAVAPEANGAGEVSAWVLAADDRPIDAALLLGESTGSAEEAPPTLPVLVDDAARSGPSPRRAAPRPRRRRSPASFLVTIGLVLMAGGVALVLPGWQELRLARMSSPEPQEIDARDLVRDGPGGNLHVELHDFALGESLAYLSDGQSDDRWRCIWVPAFPADEALRRSFEGRTSDLRLVVRSTHVHDLADLRKLRARPTLTGLLVDRVQPLEAKPRAFLSENYPLTDFGRVYVLDEGRRPSGPVPIALELGGGLLLFLTGLSCWAAFALTRRYSARPSAT